VVVDGACGEQLSTSDRRLEELHCMAEDHDEHELRQPAVHLSCKKTQQKFISHTNWLTVIGLISPVVLKDDLWG